MTEPFSAIQVTDSVYWVGAIDWNLRDFHGYATDRGTTYNAFLVVADEVTLVDTVKALFMGEMMSRIASVLPPERIDYIISNHSEMDHSGGLPAAIDQVKPEKIFASVKGVEALEAHFHLGDGITAVKDGESVSLDSGTVTFYETRMLQWPGSMFSSYGPGPDAQEGGVLFSQDAFGMHLASVERFVDELDRDILESEAAKYFANILAPYASRVSKQIEKTLALNLPIAIIAPDHGPLYRKDQGWILDLYNRFAIQKPTRKAVVAYDTMWGSTDEMARGIADGIVEGGGSVELFSMGSAHRSDVATSLLDAGAFVVGSPTTNNMMFPTVADVLSYAKGLRPKNLIGAAFGSHGWSGEAVGQIEEILEAMKVELVAEGLRVEYVPTGQDLMKCRGLGEEVGRRLREICEA